MSLLNILKTKLPIFRLNILKFLVIVSVLYGSTYQQYRHFNISDPRGESDAVSYVSMSHSNYNVNPVHRYRPAIPFAVSIVQKLLNSKIANKVELDKLSFYIVNFFITVSTALLLYGILINYGFDWKLSIMGLLFFLCSRITVISVGTPLVDSLYYLAIVVIIYFMFSEQNINLVLLFPFLVFSKETIIPFLFLPLLLRSMRNLKIVISLTISLTILFSYRYMIASSSQSLNIQSHDLVYIFENHINSNVSPTVKRLFTIEGIHDIFNGFAFLAIIAPFGMIINKRHKKFNIPNYLLLIIPISLVFGLISGNIGRMFFAAYIPVIAYSLVFIDYCFNVKDTKEQ